MPTTRLEFLVAVAGLAGAAVLTVLTAVAWRDYRDSTSSGPSVVAESGPTTTAVVAATVATEPTRPAPAPKTTTLVVRATRGESWLAVYSGSASGERLFEGTLARGRHVQFRRQRMWVRFGFPSNLSATLNSKPVDLPSGTASVIVEGRKLRTVQLG